MTTTPKASSAEAVKTKARLGVCWKVYLKWELLHVPFGYAKMDFAYQGMLYSDTCIMYVKIQVRIVYKVGVYSNILPIVIA